MKKFVSIIAVMILFSSLSSFSQENNSEINPAKKADIVKLLTLMGNEQVAYNIIKYVVNSYQRYVDAPDEYWTKLMQMHSPYKFIEMNIPVYDENFTHSEIKELIKFYESPVGRKMQRLLVTISDAVYKNEQEFSHMVHAKSKEQLQKDGKIRIESGEEKE